MLLACFRTGWFTSIQNSRTAKPFLQMDVWRRAVAAFATKQKNRGRSIFLATVDCILTLQTAIGSAGGAFFSLDTDLSWMSYTSNSDPQAVP